MTGYDAFISYTRHGSDLEAALEIESALLKAGFTVWRDKNEIVPGDKFFDEIVVALEEAKSVVAVISEESIKRAWVIGEIFTARSFEKLVPVVLGARSEIVLPFGISAHIECAQWPEGEISIVRGVQKMKARPHPHRLSRRRSDRVADGTIEVLGSVTQWPYTPQETLRLQQRLYEASAVIKNCRRSEILHAYSRYSDPQNIISGLTDMRKALARRPDAELWRALGELALPFHRDLALAAFENSSLTVQQIDERLLGGSLDAEKRERVATPAAVSEAQVSIRSRRAPLPPIPSAELVAARAPLLRKAELDLASLAEAPFAELKGEGQLDVSTEIPSGGPMTRRKFDYAEIAVAVEIGMAVGIAALFLLRML